VKRPSKRNFLQLRNGIRRLDVRACLEIWCLLNSSFGCNLYASAIQRFQPPRSGFPPTSCQVRNMARSWRSQIYFCWFARVDLRKRWGQGRGKKTEQENRDDRGRVATYVSSDTGPTSNDGATSNTLYTWYGSALHRLRCLLLLKYIAIERALLRTFY